MSTVASEKFYLQVPAFQALTSKHLQYTLYVACPCRGGQVHVKTVSHVCHRLEIPKPIQSLKKAGNL